MPGVVQRRSKVRPLAGWPWPSVPSKLAPVRAAQLAERRWRRPLPPCAVLPASLAPASRSITGVASLLVRAIVRCLLNRPPGRRLRAGSPVLGRSPGSAVAATPSVCRCVRGPGPGPFGPAGMAGGGSWRRRGAISARLKSTPAGLGESSPKPQDVVVRSAHRPLHVVGKGEWRRQRSVHVRGWLPTVPGGCPRSAGWLSTGGVAVVHGDDTEQACGLWPNMRPGLVGQVSCVDRGRLRRSPCAELALVVPRRLFGQVTAG